LLQFERWEIVVALRFEFDKFNGDVNTPCEHLAEFIKHLMLVVQFRHIDQCWQAFTDQLSTVFYVVGLLNMCSIFVVIC
jgi:hypothetical protein